MFVSVADYSTLYNEQYTQMHQPMLEKVLDKLENGVEGIGLYRKYIIALVSKSITHLVLHHSLNNGYTYKEGDTVSISSFNINPYC